MKRIPALISTLIIIMIVSGILLAGCASGGNIYGTYEGTLPCADCEGIQTTLTLDADKSFKLEEAYLGEDDSPFVTEGAWAVDNAGKITLEPSDDSDESRYYEVVSENELRMLDRTGNKIESELNYSLIKKQ